MAAFKILSFFTATHTHDCESCKLFGSIKLRTDKLFKGKVVDIYKCPKHDEIVVRYGSDGPEYVVVCDADGLRYSVAKMVIDMKGKPPKWNRELMLERLQRSDEWTTNGLVAIYNRQTEDEKAAEFTKYDNGVGFSGADAEFLSSLARYYQIHGELSPGRMALARKCMMKYAGQLAKIANGDL